MLTREFSLSLGYSEQERAVQLRFLRRVLEAVRKGDAEGARQAMARLVAGSASYLAPSRPELVSQKVRRGQKYKTGAGGCRWGGGVRAKERRGGKGCGGR